MAMVLVIEVLLWWVWSCMSASALCLQGSVRHGGGSAFSPDPVLPMVPTTMPTTVPTMVLTKAPSTAASLSLSSTPGSTCNTCPEKWVNFQRKCYYFGEGAKKWIQARLTCSELQGRLVSIHSQEEQVDLGLPEVQPARWSRRGGAPPQLLGWRGAGGRRPSTSSQSSSPVLLPRTSWPSTSTDRAPGLAFGTWILREILSGWMRCP